MTGGVKSPLGSPPPPPPPRAHDRSSALRSRAFTFRSGCLPREKPPGPDRDQFSLKSDRAVAIVTAILNSQGVSIRRSGFGQTMRPARWWLQPALVFSGLFAFITKCCTKVCPEGITITDNAIIPLKERVVDEFYDPLRKLARKVWGKS